MDTSRLNKLLTVFLSVFLTACNLKLSEKEIAAAKKSAMKVISMKMVYLFGFWDLKKSEITEKVTTINKNSLGKTIDTTRDTLNIIGNDPENCIISYEYNRPFRLNSILEITFGKEKYILSHFILKPEIVRTEMGKQLIIGCMLDSITVNGKKYTRSNSGEEMIKIRKSDSFN